MSTAAEHDEFNPDFFDPDRYVRAEDLLDFDEPDGLIRGVHPGNAELLDGPAVDAMYGLRHLRDVPSDVVPAGVVVQAVLAAQRLASWAKAQQHRWTAALARPGVAVPVANLLDSIAHRADEQGRGCHIPEELIERAAAGHGVVGDPVWDGLLASEAASFAEPELSAAWLVAPITARRRIAEAAELVEELPDTFQALEAGRVEEIRARIIAEATRCLGPELRGRAERLILHRATRGITPGDLGRLAGKIVADLDPDAAAERAEQARARRGTNVRDLGDDMARFTADVAAEDAALTHGLLNLLADAIPAEGRAGRGTSQLRADIFADLFTQLLDTGLIDLRGTLTDPDPDAEPNQAQPNQAEPDEAEPEAAEPGEAESDAARPAQADTAADPSPEGTDTAPTEGEPENQDRDVDLDTADSHSADSHPADPTDQTDEADPAEADGPDAADQEPDNQQPDEDAADTWRDEAGQPQSTEDQPAAADTDPPAPTVAELLARLRSIDWESRLDPDCARRGGLLSMIRLPAGLRVNLDVTVALSTLTGHDELSARLAGLGVITADTARALAKAAGTVRILLTGDPPGSSPPPNQPDGSPPDTGGQRPNNGGIHHNSPDCGSVLDFGRTVYRPPASVIDRVNTRDQRCRFPGCAHPAIHCDHDHRTTWNQGGATCPCDIDALCRFHHRIKTFTAWTATRDHNANTLTWTSPLGRINIDRPAPDLPTGTPLNLADPPEAGPQVTDPAENSASANEIDIQSADLEAGRDPDEPPF